MTKVLIVDAGSRDIAKELMRHYFDDWCHCAGHGYWYEQIDGPNNKRLVKCAKHWLPEMQKRAEEGRR